MPSFARAGHRARRKHTFTGLFPIVLDNLRDAGTQVAQRTHVSQRHAHDAHDGRRRGGRFGLLGAVPRAGLVRGEPAGRAQQVDGGQAHRVVQPAVAVGGLVLARDDACQGVAEARLVGPNRGPALRPGDDARRRPAPQQRLVLGGGGLGRLGALACGCPAGVDGVVVQALRDEDEVGEAKVCSQGGSGRCDSGDERPCRFGVGVSLLVFFFPWR